MIIPVDFDGVLSTYESGWQGAHVTQDPPVDGAIEWLRSLIEDPRFEAYIFSSRNHQLGGVAAMREWLALHGLDPQHIEQLGMPIYKPPGFLTIDDRVLQFTGVFPSLDTIAKFKPWWKE